ncbi:cell wall-binding repeat-containing protein [Herbiconiux daphne]|uniref:Cell wall-binding repeat-containing protein n=1 Tax=Herbiconiux daphne TaxID=2970914 RepID=A0ABT2H376_9MICO|nr:cell wall-binding repeat-containing protein [Herbiconiux daphne]MCS5734398.1 cell wall-binding repeat-containing protein [Herbiconiux daphne]
MSRRSVYRRTAAAVTAAAAIITGGVMTSGAAQAEALAPVAITCPSPVAAVGFPIDSSLLATNADRLSVDTGALPAGVALNSTEGYHLIGSPTGVQTVTFILSASGAAADGTPTTIAKACSIEVKPGPAVNRIAGADRYQQAIKVSQLFPSAGTVFVASGEKYPDALSATAIAAAHGAPLLLTPANGVPAGLTDEIARLNTTKVVVVGGEATISAATLAQLQSSGRVVTRIGGADRHEVSRNLISDAEFGISTATTAFVATGANFPDALTASPAAFVNGAPVLLVNGAETALTAAESTVLDDLNVTRVSIAGGPNSVSAALQLSMADTYSVDRFAGADRFEVGVNINRAAFPRPTSFVVASGTAFADALSGGVPAAISTSPLYVTQSTCLTTEVYREIGRLAPAQILILGGTATLSADVEALTPCGE